MAHRVLVLLVVLGVVQGDFLVHGDHVEHVVGRAASLGVVVLVNSDTGHDVIEIALAVPLHVIELSPHADLATVDRSVRAVGVGGAGLKVTVHALDRVRDEATTTGGVLNLGGVLVVVQHGQERLHLRHLVGAEDHVVLEVVLVLVHPTGVNPVLLRGTVRISLHLAADLHVCGISLERLRHCVPRLRR